MFYCFSNGDTFGHTSYEILKGSLFPTDECETCGYQKEDCAAYNQPEENNEFKPRLAKVVGLKMVERCENCGKPNGEHHENLKTHDDECIGKYASIYKPVQEAEIKTE